MNIADILAFLSPGQNRLATGGLAPSMFGDTGSMGNPAVMNALANLSGPQAAQAPAQAFQPEQAPQGQPMPQGAPAPAQGGGGGFLSGISDWLSGGQNSTITKNTQFLIDNGETPARAQLIARDPKTFHAYLLEKTATPDPRDALEVEKLQLDIEEKRRPPTTDDIREYQFAKQNGYTGSFEDWRQINDPAGRPTDDMREYDRAVEQGFQGSFMDYQVKMKEAGRSQVNIDTGVKLPPGYKWIDPKNQDAGVEPIEGGPAEQIPGELAARIGMADSFLGQYGDVRKKVEAGIVTGPIDRARAGFGQGEQGEVYRQIRSGSEALQRLLTGAGMPESEAQVYADRYLPTYRDDANSMLSKLDQLKRELESAKKMAMRGRGELPPPPAPTGPSAGGADLSAMPPPPGIEPDVWKFMPPEDRALWQ